MVEKQRDILAEARQRFRYCQEHESYNRQQALEALEFIEGDQWPRAIKEERERENRPCLVINRVPAFTRQVTNDIRQIRPAIKTRPVDSQSDPDTAEALMGMIRAIEQDSSAESAYDWAAQYAVEMGWGYWRIAVDYVDGKSFDQKVTIERVKNPFSVYLDPMADAQDGSDAKYGFIVERMRKTEFEAKYPDAKSEWEAGDDDREWWFGEDHVRVAEYWEIVETPLMLSLVLDVETGEQQIVNFEVDPMAIEAGLVQVLATRQGVDRKIVHRLITAAEILEEKPYVGDYIPIVRCMGREKDIQGEDIRKGMVKDLMDPQRQYNYWRSASTERVALYAKAPYVGPKGAFKNPKWRSANTKSYAYLEYDGDIAPRREPPPDISPGFANELQVAAEELKAVSSIHDPSLGARSNEVSGVAIDSRQGQSDTANFDFVDNLAKAMTYSGKILVDLIPKIYTGQRMVRILGLDGKDELVQLNEPFVDDQGRERMIDFTAGKYDVTVDIGPAYATQRREAADKMVEFAQQFPGAAQVTADLVAKNMDWPNSDEFVKRIQATLPMEILQGENPQMQMMLQQFEQEREMMQGQMMEMQQQMQQMYQALMDKDRDLSVKEGDLRRKIAKDIMDNQVDMTDLELEAGRDLTQAGAAY